MPQSVLNSAGGDMPDNDNDGGSYIEPTNNEQRRNPSAVHGGWSSLIPQACNTKNRTSVGDLNGNSTGGRLRKYRGVTRSSRKWMARASKKDNPEKSKNREDNPEKSKNRVYLGSFPTAEMAAVASDAAILVLRAESRPNCFNFPEYSAHVKSIVEGFPPSDIANRVKYVAWKAAENIAPLLSLENKDREFGVSPLISQQPKHQGFEVSAAMPAAAISSSSASFMSSNIGMPHSIPNTDFPVVRPTQVKQRIKVAARPAGRARARQVRRKIYNDKQETQTVKQTKQHIQYEQAINDSGICSFSVVQESEHEYSTPVDTATDNVNNQKIQPSSNTLGGGADSAVSSFSLAYEPLHESSIQQPKFPISNPNSMPRRVQSFDELIDVTKEHYMP